MNQSGGRSYPNANASWAQEISLDLDIVSAMCPNCTILLVEARSKTCSDLTTAVDYAASVPGAVAISNSYGSGEFFTQTSLDTPLQPCWHRRDGQLRLQWLTACGTRPLRHTWTAVGGTTIGSLESRMLEQIYVWFGGGELKRVLRGR